MSVYGSSSASKWGRTAGQTACICDASTSRDGSMSKQVLAATGPWHSWQLLEGPVKSWPTAGESIGSVCQLGELDDCVSKGKKRVFGYWRNQGSPDQLLQRLYVCQHTCVSLLVIPKEEMATVGITQTMAWVGKDLKGHLIPNPLHRQEHLTPAHTSHQLALAGL